jgi:hypothetical protein
MWPIPKNGPRKKSPKPSGTANRSPPFLRKNFGPVKN